MLIPLNTRRSVQARNRKEKVSHDRSTRNCRRMLDGRHKTPFSKCNCVARSSTRDRLAAKTTLQERQDNSDESMLLVYVEQRGIIY